MKKILLRYWSSTIRPSHRIGGEIYPMESHQNVIASITQLNLKRKYKNTNNQFTINQNTNHINILRSIMAQIVNWWNNRILWYYLYKNISNNSWESLNPYYYTPDISTQTCFYHWLIWYHNNQWVQKKHKNCNIHY